MEKLIEEFKEELKAIKESTKKIDEKEEEIKELNTRLEEIEKVVSRPPLNVEEEQKEKELIQTKAFISFLKHGKAEMKPDEKKELVEDNDGRILVPEEIDSQLIEFCLK